MQPFPERMAVACKLATLDPRPRLNHTGRGGHGINILSPRPWPPSLYTAPTFFTPILLPVSIRTPAPHSPSLCLPPIPYLYPTPHAESSPGFQTCSGRCTWVSERCRQPTVTMEYHSRYGWALLQSSGLSGVPTGSH